MLVKRAEIRRVGGARRRRRRSGESGGGIKRESRVNKDLRVREQEGGRSVCKVISLAVLPLALDCVCVCVRAHERPVTVGTV